MSETVQLKDLRLGFVSARSIYMGDGAWTLSGVGRLLEIWSKTCRSVTVAMSYSAQRHASHDMPLKLSHSDILPLPSLESTARGLGQLKSCRRVIREVERRSDVVIVQLPFASPLALLRPRCPRVYHLCHDIWGVAKNSPLYGGYKRLPALLVGGAIDRLQRRLLHARHARTVCNGNELLAHYGHPHGRGVVSTVLRDAEIQSAVRRRPRNAPMRVLFVGHLRPEKGFDVLLEAFRQLLDEVPTAELFVVGPLDTIDRGMNAQITQGLRTLAEKTTVQHFDHLEFGPELFQCFADADVLALPSRAEGTPRVLVEARAFGCPVVATRVGGVPTSVEDRVDGLLVKPGNPRELMTALLSLHRDLALRETLIAGGLRRARQCTVEAFAAALCEEALAAVGGCCELTAGNFR